jgi:tetratricopeptide (TPR) repeat protein
MTSRLLLTFLLIGYGLANGQTTNQLNDQALELAKNGQIKKALDRIDKSIKLDSKKKETYLSQGLIYFTDNDYENSEISFKRCLDLDSTYVEPYDYLAAIYFKRKSYRHGLIFLDKAIQLEPTVKRLQGRADLRGMTHDYQGTVDDCDAIIRLEPTNANAYFTRGNAKFGLRDKEGACADLKRAIELGKPKDSFFIKYCEI